MFLTGTTDTVYAIVMLDLERDGPTVIEEPGELAANWVQTVPGKGWFVLLRLYGPLETWFDGTWRPGDVEPLSAS